MHLHCHSLRHTRPKFFQDFPRLSHHPTPVPPRLVPGRGTTQKGRGVTAAEGAHDHMVSLVVIEQRHQFSEFTHLDSHLPHGTGRVFLQSVCKLGILPRPHNHTQPFRVSLGRLLFLHGLVQLFSGDQTFGDDGVDQSLSYGLSRHRGALLLDSVPLCLFSVCVLVIVIVLVVVMLVLCVSVFPLFLFAVRLHSFPQRLFRLFPCFR
mmetsp:Transcript_13550/g.26886  ORF Transcript_13550/g.26886 Transcript_13550/m.26886 type:complete len:207 (-) Transcript_13550:816-1436(-)